MAHVYYRMLMYMEIELLLTVEIFDSDNNQFAKIMQESFSLVGCYLSCEYIFISSLKQI